MKSIVYIITIVAVALCFSSCEDYNRKIIEFEDIGYEPQLVINSKLSSSSDTLFISVSRNLNYAEASDAEFIKINDATVMLTIDGEENITASEITFPAGSQKEVYNYIVVIDSEDFLSKRYEILATHPDYPDAYAETYLPKESELLNIEFRENAFVEAGIGETFEYDGYETTFRDNPDEENYYAFTILIKFPNDTIISEVAEGVFDTTIFSGGSYEAYTITNDVNAVDEETGSALYSDENFNGEEITFNLYFENYGNELEKLIIYENISKSEFLFRQSFSRYQNSQDFGFFSEPTTLFTNVEGGLGLFSAVDRYEITP